MCKLLFVILFFGTQIFANLCTEDIGHFPIQQRGRIKPLLVHAKETIRYLRPKTKSSLELYCTLSFSFAEKPKTVLNAKIEHVDVKKFLDLEDSQHEIPYDDLVDQFMLIRSEWNKQKSSTSYKKSLQNLMSRVGLYKSVVEGTDWMIPSPNVEGVNWVPLKDVAKVNGFNLDTLNKYNAAYLKTEGDDHITELKFSKAHLPGWAMVFSLLALAFLTLFKKFKVAVAFTVITVITQIVLMVFRVIISGRAPITNMYETVMFSGFGALVLALIIMGFKKERSYLFVGLAYNVMTLMMMNFATGMLSESISPLVPVLRDNFWLSTHVTTIILSYGALALSWVLANTILIKKKFFTFSKQDEAFYGDNIYTCIKVGSVLLAAGIILGGVWADYSWGRFWGWDPKETWSLIVLLIYMAILHGKYTNWISNATFVPLVALAFLSVMMAWFGVNYILASGLHSYGFSEGGAIFLGSFFLAQFVVLGLTYKKS